jgi:threonine dehydrogenase-like Zn-dependent dehydrogenase
MRHVLVSLVEDRERTYIMKSYHINLGAGLAGLMVKEHDIPVPGPHEVLVRVRACPTRCGSGVGWGR